MDDESSSAVYQNPRVESTTVDGYPIVIAEIPHAGEGRYRRTHQRIIGGDESSTAGRTIIYSDTYPDAPDCPTYAYAHHDADRATFFRLLAEFLTSTILVELPELRDRPARCVIQTDEALEEREFGSYLIAADALRSIPLTFVRLYFPFGDMTIEFKPRALVANEFDFIAKYSLTKQLETPLFAFGASESEIWISFLAMIHWARTLIEPAVLRSILRMAAPAYA